MGCVLQRMVSKTKGKYASFPSSYQQMVLYDLQSKFYTIFYFTIFLSQEYENTVLCHQQYLGATFSIYVNGKTSKSSTKLYENSL